MRSTPSEPSGLSTALEAVADLLAAFEGDVGQVADAAEARRLAEQVTAVQARLHAVLARVTAQVEERGLHGADGHRTVHCWLAHATRTSPGAASAVAETGRMMRHCERIAKAHAIGELGTAQAERLALLHRNPRVGHLLADHEEALLDAAATLQMRGFVRACQYWEQLADQDGAEQASERRHTTRNGRLVRQPDGRYVLEGSFGEVVGEAMNEAFEQFLTAERLADRDDEELAARTEPQRRADALYALFMAAASTPPDAQRPEPLVNIVVTQDRLEAYLAGEPDPGGLCETLDGHPLQPGDAAAAVLIGRIRRVIYDSAGVVIDLGRTSRLFRGSARDAVVLADRHCRWLTCGRPARHCQCDHTTDWAHGGHTDQCNAGLFCGFHNRLKQHGFRVWRDPTGRWRFYRPDGTEIT